MISDDDIEACLSYLIDKAEAAAQARANRIYLQEYSKSLLAELMAERDNLKVTAQEREALADQRYRTHLQALREAIFRDEKHRFLMKAAEAKIEAWRTLNANMRVQAKL